MANDDRTGKFCVRAYGSKLFLTTIAVQPDSGKEEAVWGNVGKRFDLCSEAMAFHDRVGPNNSEIVQMSSDNATVLRVVVSSPPTNEVRHYFALRHLMDKNQWAIDTPAEIGEVNFGRFDEATRYPDLASAQLAQQRLRLARPLEILKVEPSGTLITCEAIEATYRPEEKAKKPETVNHPAHYGGKDNPLEAIKVIEANGWGIGFCLGNVYKYMSRAGKKDGVELLEDLRKSAWYLNRAIEQIDGPTAPNGSLLDRVAIPICESDLAEQIATVLAEYRLLPQPKRTPKPTTEKISVILYRYLNDYGTVSLLSLCRRLGCSEKPRSQPVSEYIVSAAVELV